MPGYLKCETRPLARVRLRWLASACALVLASCHEPTSPNHRAYDLTFDDSYGIYETAVDSVQVRAVMHDTLPTYDISWSADGREVVFTRQYYQAGQYFYRAVIYSATTGTEWVLTQGPNDSFQPAWSPDGSRIAYLSRPPGSLDATLRTIRPDGTGDQQLGPIAYYVRPPRWSPDGNEIAATRNDITVIIIDASTGSLIRTIAPGMSPTWSPDGKQLAFVANGITVIGADGSNPRLLPVTGYDPAWSPDGNWIAFDRLGVYMIPPNAVDTTGLRFVAPYNRPAWRQRQ